MKPSARKVWVKKIVSKWRPRLFLGEWHIDIVYAKVQPENSNVYAECKSSSAYLEADIYIYPNFWKMNSDRWEHTLVHEMAHCLTSATSKLLTDALSGTIHPQTSIDFHIEQLTQRIANVAFQQEWPE